MKEFDKTLRLVMPFALLLLVIFIIAMNLSGRNSSIVIPDIGSAGFGTKEKEAKWFEPSWESQVNSVRLGQSDRIEVSQEIIGDPHLLQLRDLDGLRELIIDRGQITENGLAPLQTLRNLEHLRISSKIRDAAFKQLCNISSLRILNLPQADLTDVGLELLPQLRQLKQLRFTSPRVTDQGLKQIARVTSLSQLHLIDIPITDNGLKTLAAIRSLESLYLDGAQVSNAGYEQLFRTNPDLHVHIDQLSRPQDHHHPLDPQKNGHRH